MKTVIVCFLCLFLRQVISEVLPPLENASEVKGVEAGILFGSDPPSCNIEGGILGCSNDCKAIRFCLNQEEVILDCLKQTGLPNCNQNNEKSECTSAAVDCPDTIIPPFKCPGNGYYPYALNCAKVWKCTENAPKAKLLACGAGTVFHPLNRNCSIGVPCYTFSSVNGLCKGKEGLLVTHPLNGGIYAHCNGPFPSIYECPNDLIFNTKKLTCEFECKSTGVFKDPLEPKKCFYTCTKNSGVLQKTYECCAKDEEFDENLSGCNVALNK